MVAYEMYVHHTRVLKIQQPEWGWETDTK